MRYRLSVRTVLTLLVYKQKTIRTWKKSCSHISEILRTKQKRLTTRDLFQGLLIYTQPTMRHAIEMRTTAMILIVQIPTLISKHSSKTLIDCLFHKSFLLEYQYQRQCLPWQRFLRSVLNERAPRQRQCRRIHGIFQPELKRSKILI